MFATMRLCCLFILPVLVQENGVQSHDHEKRSSELGGVVVLEANASPSETRQARKERARIVMSGPALDIHASGTSRVLVFRFRTRGLVPPSGETIVSVPVVQAITMGKADNRGRLRKPDCVVSGEAPVRMTEWRYGDAPAGYEMSGCGELTTGEYVISVRILGGGGGLGLTIDDKGTVTPHPLPGSTEPLWDGK
jgi:hypothetical protein